MKKILPLFLPILLCACSSRFESQTTFTENTDVFPNPGQGWERCLEERDGLNNVNFGGGYLRFWWRDLEPEEGKYNWQPVDKAIERFAKQGLPFYTRIMCISTSGYPQRWQSPKWVFDKGAKYTETILEKPANKKFPDGKVPVIVPDFADPIFMAAHEKFIKAFAARYDGDPRIGGIDLGSYGNWGEWHCWGLGLGDYGADKSPHSVEVRKAWADMYLKNFKKTQIISMTDDAAILKHNIGDGVPRVGMRRDGVGSPSHFKTWIGAKRYSKIPNMGEVWKYQPIVFESFQSVDKMKSWGWDILFSLNWMLENHVSIVNEGPFQPHQIKAGTPEAEALRNVDLYAGARLVPQAANLFYHNGKMDVKLVGVNKGVAKIYLPYEFVYEVRGADGALVAEKVSKCDPRSILTGEFEISDSFDLPLEKGKDYSISLRVRNIAKVLRDFRFAAKNLNEDGSLPLGKFSLR